MKLLQIVMFMIFVTSCHFVSLAQSNIYSTITKNINTKASSLEHNLNASGDSLLLKSDYPLSKIEIISDSGFQEMPLGGDKKQAKVPLSFLDVGNYTLSVVFIEGKDDTYIYSKTVVFKIARLLPIMEYSNANTRLASSTDLNSDDISIQMNFDDMDSDQTPKTDKFRNKIKETHHKVAKHDMMKQFLPPSEALVNIKAFNPEKVANLPVKIAEKQIANKQITEKKSSIFVPYSLSDPRRISRDPRYVIQTRAEYRAANLRPNGKPYD